jgi:hypothetical protein
MPRKRKKYAKPFSLFPLTPTQTLSTLLSVSKDDAARIRGESAAKLRAWRIPKKKKGK